MYRKWKSTAALGLAALLGCMMPMGTMLAAEEDTGDVVDSVSENDAFYVDGNIPVNEAMANGESTPGDVTVTDRESTPGDAAAPEGETTPDGEGTDGTQEAGIMAVPAAEPNAETEDAESAGAPEIRIERGGENRACSLGGKITFEYIGYQDTLFKVSVGGDEGNVSLFSALDRVKDTETEAKEEEQMGSLLWGEITSLPGEIMALNDGNYVVYVKAVKKAENGDEKSYYARSGGIVVDTERPVIKGVEEGKSYPEGTLFQVEDANLDTVLVNEKEAESENGNYKVAANGTSCVIRAKDKAGHETTCSIIVFGNVAPGPEPEEPGPETPDESNAISESGEYALKTGVKYHLAEGKWKVDGDKSVYQGGSDFYVAADGSYIFSK